jgi:hypothetical protein
MSEIVLTDATGTPKSHNAQMAVKVYFWHNPRTDHIMSGAPPQYDRLKPPGYQTIECAHAYQVETWSRRLNEQEKRIQEMDEYERLELEKPMLADLRRELNQQLNDLEKNKNKAAAAGLLKLQLRKLDEYEAKFYSKYESFMHAEAFEDGK